jgi:hypothetical protein
MAALVWGHRVSPAAYSRKEIQELVQLYQDASDQNGSLNVSQIEQFLKQKDAAIIHGNALYPIYFKSNTGALNYSWLSFASKPYERLVFYMIGAEPAGVILPTDISPISFPDGTDVLVVGCRTETGDIDAVSVVITGTEFPLVYDRSPMPALTCPLVEPE